MKKEKPETITKKEMPLSIKIISGVTAIFTIFILYLFTSAQMEDIFYLLGFELTGISARSITLILEVLAPLILLFAIWKTYPWTWKYGACYFGFFVLNEIFTLALNLDQLSFDIITLLNLLIPLILNVLFAKILIKERDYFEN